MSDVKHNVIVTGVPTPPGQAKQTPYLRKPIQELIKDKKQFHLYIQALRKLMETDHKDQLSWFAIGGIHGSPKLPWDSVPGGSDSTWGGYCTHASVLFPTWHRPYVLLFEQALVQCAVKIADEYKGPDAAEWMMAAQTLRSPYWDWAAHAIPPDEVIEIPKLKIVTAKGEEEVDNPLLMYTYRAGEPRVDRLRHTVRCPNPTDHPNETDVKILKHSLQTLDNVNNPVRARIFSTLHNADTWEYFSNKRTSQGAFFNSLESIHDQVHGAVGGIGGEMNNPSIAAFDPSFWLHHANVDRLLALWQALHPNVWVSAVTGDGEAGTYTIPKNSHVNEDTDLTPFWNGYTTFFKSSTDGVRRWQATNYEYPEFQGLSLDNPEHIRLRIESKVLELYGSDDKDITRTIGGGAPCNFATRTDWLVRLCSKPASVQQSFTVFLFLGEPPTDWRDFLSADSLLGLHFEFVNSEQGSCANCVINADVITEGFVNLTRALKLRGLYERPEEEIEKYIKDNLRWRVQKADASIIEPDEVTALEISVITITLQYLEDKSRWAKLPNAVPVHRNLTSHLPGGFGYNQ